MTEISAYALVVLIGVAIFGALLAGVRFLQARRIRQATGEIRKLEGRAVRDLGKEETAEKVLRDEDLLDTRPALYGIPYLAWILTSLLIPAAFGILFFENLVNPYLVPDVGSVAWHSYRAPAAFEFAGREYERHELLIPPGTRVSSWERQVVEQALAHRALAGGEVVLGSLVLLVIFVFILLYHMNILYPSSTEKNRNLILIFLTILIVLACAKVSLFYDFFSPYLIPVPWAGMVIAIFINRRIVPLIMLTTLILVSLVSSFDFSLFLVLLAGGLVSGSWVREARRRGQLIAASFLVGLIMVAVYLCASLLVQGEVELSPDVLAAFANGIFSGLLALIVLPVFEILFDYASNFRLMELMDLNTPLLKELFFKAPGTYQHTMALANVAEAVANEIGANGLLVRVGAYYHDIGKMFNPEYFIENQVGGENPHDRLGPVASAAVVRSHVILGVKLARQMRLPGPIIDFIREHHGTSTIDYFYFKSKELDSGMKSERIFKYSGPRPQSRETAIVMLVDAVEAASRVLKDRNEETVRELVQKIATRKLEQGELDRSGLTIGEFKKLIDVLTYILRSTSHQRVEYPEEAMDEDDAGTPGRLRVVKGQRGQGVEESDTADL